MITLDLECLPLNLMALRRDIKNVWQTIRCSLGYREWLNANVTCYLVKVQMITIIHCLQRQQQQEQMSRDDDLDFDVLYEKMIQLWVENIDDDNIEKYGNVLLNNLYRIRYFCT